MTGGSGGNTQSELNQLGLKDAKDKADKELREFAASKLDGAAKNFVKTQGKIVEYLTSGAGQRWLAVYLPALALFVGVFVVNARAGTASQETLIEALPERFRRPAAARPGKAKTAPASSPTRRSRRS